MAKKSNLTLKILGLIFIVAGIGLAIWGYQLSGSFGSQLSVAFTGSDSDAVMIRYIAGAACFVVGLFLVVKK